MGRKLGGQKLMIVHLHKKKKKCFFRIILIALSLVKQFVQTLTVQSEEWVTSAFQYCLWEVEGLSSPHHRSSPPWSVWTCHGSHLQKAYIVSGHCLSQNVTHCRKSKYQTSMWDFHALRGRGSLYKESFHFLSSKKIGNEYKREFKQVLL